MALTFSSAPILCSIAVLALLWPQASPANIIAGTRDRDGADPDGRASLLAVGPNFGLAAADINRIRRSTGYVFCRPVGPDGQVHSLKGSGFLGATGDLVITSAHELREAIAIGGEGALASCYFRPQDGSSDKVMFDPRGGSYFLGDAIGSGAQGAVVDVALFSLAHPVQGAAPIPLAEAEPPAGTEILKISASEADMGARVDYREPIAVLCQIREAFAGEPVTFSDGTAGIAPPGFYSDCDTKKQASGGASLAWIGAGAERRLEIVGLTVGTGDDKYDGAPFDPRHSHTYHLGVTNVLADFVGRLAQHQPVPPALAGDAR